jgi:predicted ArsR family transcriptional regulator
LSVSNPRSADYVANEAAVSKETAKDHLDSLVDLTIVLEHDVDERTMYGPDPLYTRFQTIRNLLNAHDRDGLIEIRDDLRDQVQTWLRDRAAGRESSPASEEPHRVVNEWELVEHRLGLIKVAIDLS